MTTAAPSRSRRKTAVIPATMKAAAIDRFGPPSVLKLHTVEVPELDDHEVLIALHTAGVGIWDAKARAGEWATGKEKFPLVLGTDGAGVIAAKGSRVRRLDVGDRVWAYAFDRPKGGFYAEYVVVDANSVYPLPRGLNMLQAGVALVTGLTALQGIRTFAPAAWRDRAHLRRHRRGGHTGCAVRQTPAGQCDCHCNRTCRGRTHAQTGCG